MSKYFSQDSELFNYTSEVTSDDPNNKSPVIPSTENLTSPLDEQKKESLRIPADSIDENDYISLVHKQTAAVSDMVAQYSHDSKQEIKRQFDKFSPAELFEKMNQMMFVISTLNNKVDELSSLFAKTQMDTPSEDKELSNPEDLYVRQEKQRVIIQNENIPQQIPTKSTVDSVPAIGDITKQLSNIKSGAPQLPDDGYTDSSINLEQMFPDLDDEAYQAAYSSMTQSDTPSKTEVKRPTPGDMRGIVF